MDCERYAKRMADKLLGFDTVMQCDRRHFEMLIATAYEQGRIDGAEQIMPLAPAMLAALRDAEFYAGRIKNRNDALRIRCEVGRVLRWWKGR